MWSEAQLATQGFFDELGISASHLQNCGGENASPYRHNLRPHDHKEPTSLAEDVEIQKLLVMLKKTATMSRSTRVEATNVVRFSTERQAPPPARFSRKAKDEFHFAPSA